MLVKYNDCTGSGGGGGGTNFSSGRLLSDNRQDNVLVGTVFPEELDIFVGNTNKNMNTNKYSKYVFAVCDMTHDMCDMTHDTALHMEMRTCAQTCDRTSLRGR